MTKIKNYNEYINQDTLYVFDFDDTLAITPRFEDVILPYINEDRSVKDLLDNSVKLSGCSIGDLEYENGRIYVNDTTNKYKEVGNWKRKGSRLYLLSPNIFSTLDESFPEKTTELLDFYNSVENKCIVTARPEINREKLTKVMSKLGIDFPKYGLYMLPSRRRGAGIWKGEEIVKIIKETGFNKVIFYDDNPKYISKATRVVKSQLPDIDWSTIRVS